MTDLSSSALSDQELIALDSFILSLEHEDGCLPVDEAHGYLTGRLVAGNRFKDDSWMEGIWGKPAFADQKEAEDMKGLLTRLCEDVQAALDSNTPFEPLVAEIEEENGIVEAFEGWCFGFMLAASEEEERWEDLPRNEQSLFAPIAKLAMLHTDEDFEMEDDEYEMLIELIPGSVTGLKQYWDKIVN